MLCEDAYLLSSRGAGSRTFLVGGIELSFVCLSGARAVSCVGHGSGSNIIMLPAVCAYIHMLSLSLARSCVLPRRNPAKALSAGRTNAAPKCKDRVRNFLRSFRMEARTRDHLTEPDTPEASDGPKLQYALRPTVRHVYQHGLIVINTTITPRQI